MLINSKARSDIVPRALDFDTVDASENEDKKIENSNTSSAATNGHHTKNGFDQEPAAGDKSGEALSSNGVTSAVEKADVTEEKAVSEHKGLDEMKDSFQDQLSSSPPNS